MIPCLLHLIKKQGGGLNALCQYQQPPNLDLSRPGWGLGGSSLVTAVGVNRDFCCWQADVNQSGHKAAA